MDKIQFDFQEKKIVEQKINLLNEQYIMLSKLEDMFPRTSKNKVYFKVRLLMDETLAEIQITKKLIE
jgi:hypothetical protein